MKVIHKMRTIILYFIMYYEIYINIFCLIKIKYFTTKFKKLEYVKISKKKLYVEKV